MKKIVALLLCLGLLAALPLPALAAGAETASQADTLHELGLFQGVGTGADGKPDYALDRVPTRTEALVMLVRALGKESAALSENDPCPFSDVPAWAKPYVGYAYRNGLTNGVSDTLFGAREPAVGYTYLTFMLRALGYSDAAGGDFAWNDPYALAADSGILRYDVDTEHFLRGDAVAVTYYALSAAQKGTQTTLLSSLTASGAVDAAAAERTGLQAQYDPRSDDFSRSQSDNFWSGGMAAWDGACTYLLAKTADEVYQLFAWDGSGAPRSLYQTNGTRLSRLSLHEGKLYFCEDTSLSVDSPHYALMELDPQTGRTREVYGSLIFEGYFWYDGMFYILDCEPGTYRPGYSTEILFDLRSVTSGGQVTGTLCSGLTFEQEVGFSGCGWNGAIYWKNGIKGTNDVEIWRFDPATGLREKLYTGMLINPFYVGGQIYYCTYTKNGTEYEYTLQRAPLDAPGDAERVASVGNGYGQAYLKNGRLYYSNLDSGALYQVLSDGTLEKLAAPPQNAHLTLFSHYAVAPGDCNILLSAPDDVTLYDLNAPRKISYLSWIGGAN